MVYYGVVATPVVDIYSGTAPVPTAFVVSSCVTSASPELIHWNLDAISLETGVSMGTTTISSSGFNPSYQLSRASLLLGVRGRRGVGRGPGEPPHDTGVRAP